MSKEFSIQNTDFKVRLKMKTSEFIVQNKEHRSSIENERIQVMQKHHRIQSKKQVEPNVENKEYRIQCNKQAAHNSMYWKDNRTRSKELSEGNREQSFNVQKVYKVNRI